MDILDFLDNSSTFNSISFKGYYDMPKDVFKELWDHFNRTGENLLDCYSRIKYLTWGSGDNVHYDRFEFDNFNDQISKIRALNIVASEEVNLALSNLRLGHKKWLEFQKKMSNEPRRKACLYTGRKDVRKAVFKIHGEACLCCRSKDDMSLDHVVPVSKGGVDAIDNLQPLCKSCNSKKGDKIIDYRHG